MLNGKLQQHLSLAAFNRVFLSVLCLPILGYLVFRSLDDDSLGFLTPSAQGSLSMVLALLVLFVAHEFIHIAVLWIGGVETGNIALVIDRESLSIGIDVDQPISLRLWRVSLLAPLVLLGALLAAIGLQQGSESPAWLLLALSTSGCAYDVSAFAALLGHPADTCSLPRFIVTDERLAFRRQAA